jgi:mono/diheme cytochrome c family protein
VSGRNRIAALFVAAFAAATVTAVDTHAVDRQASRAPSGAGTPAGQSAVGEPSTSPRSVVNQYCIACHSQRLRTADVDLETLDLTTPGANAETWEKVIAKLRAGSMPPPGRPRPDPAVYHAVAGALEREIDREWDAHPDPGHLAAVHRLNRAEYNNAIRDLLAVDIDVKSLLPGDETADGSFDNFADALSISTAHLERYLSVARQVTRLAIGLAPVSPALDRFEIPLHVLQEDRQSEDLPLGSRGGIAIHYDFPVTGEYLIKVRLQRQYQDYLKGMGWPQRLDVRLDSRLVKRFTVGGQAQGRAAAASYAGDGEPGFAGDDSWEKYMQIGGDAGLEIRVPVDAGPHIVGVSFVRELWEPEGLPQPLQRGRVIANDQVYMDYANVGSVQIGGPYTKSAAAADTPSRRAIFVCRPKAEADERRCASTVLTRLARLAYRRPATAADVQTLLRFFDDGRREGHSFDSGIQFALERMLVDPDFLLRVYRAASASQPVGQSASPPVGQSASRGIGRLSDLEIASRLSFFLWSSIPDDRLLTLAERGQLAAPGVLEKETRRLLADPRATKALVDNFAAQWLNLRRVEDVVVDPDRYPNYDLSLLQAFQRETELFVGSTIREDRSVVDLLNANYTFVNERLARHYGIPDVYGSRFRRVTLSNPNERGGLLAEGALLATTSYPDRTSPVLRGKWLLNNIFGLPVPPPPPGVDTNLDNKAGGVPATIRERLAQHRKNPSCSSCHSVIDPLGFALENFDVIGGWRTVDEAGQPVDAAGATASGEKVEGLAGLRALLLAQPEQFPRTVTEKLLAYALGRPLTYSDRPAVRKIVRDAAARQYRWSSLIAGIVQSPTFLLRTAQAGSN